MFFIQVVDLNLNENLVSSLSPDLGRMSSLQTLRLQNNRIGIADVPENLFVESQVQKLVDG